MIDPARVRRPLLCLAFFLLSLSLGFAFTRTGVSTWDSLQHLIRGDWLIGKYGLPTHGHEGRINDTLMWYGPLWELWIGFSSATILSFVQDPTWVRHAMTFSLFPVTLALIVTLLRRVGYSKSTSFLCASLVFCLIRLGGHSLLNVTDAPLATFYTISGFAIWLGARRILVVEAAGDSRPQVGRLLVTTFWVLAPYLVRPPVLLPLVIWLGVVAWIPLPNGVSRPWKSGLARSGAVLLGAMALCFLLWPSLWVRGYSGWGHSFRQFASFPWIGPVRAWGVTHLSTSLPRSYAFLWFPVVMTPLAFLCAGLGLIGHALPSACATPTGNLPLVLPGGYPISLSFRACLGLFAALGWLAVLAMHPVLYDEDRHLLFLFPPLMIWAGLGWEAFAPRFRWMATLLCVVSGLVSYAGWGVYSYVYKSRLAGDRSPDAYMGDYWGVCVPRLLLKLPQHAPSGSELVVPGPTESAEIQLARMGKSQDYTLLAQPSGTREFFAIQFNRMGALTSIREDVARGKAIQLERESMPPGDDACLMVKYPLTSIRRTLPTGTEAVAGPLK